MKVVDEFIHDAIAEQVRIRLDTRKAALLENLLRHSNIAPDGLHFLQRDLPIDGTPKQPQAVALVGERDAARQNGDCSQ